MASLFEINNSGNLHEIVPNLFLGNQFATHPDTLYQHGIECVYNVGGKQTDLNYNRYKLTAHSIIEISDSPDAAKKMLDEVIPHGVSFIDKCFENRKRVLVHCAMGVSRSATVVTAWLMKRYGMSRDEALLLVKSARTVANPNEGFMQALKSYETFLKRVHAHRSVLRGATGGGGRSYYHDNEHNNSRMTRSMTNANNKKIAEHFQNTFKVLPSGSNSFKSECDVSYFREYEEKMYNSDDAFQHKY